MVYKPGKWNLDDVMKSKDIERTIKEVDSLVKKFESYKNKLTQTVSVDIVNELIDISETISLQGGRLQIYASLGMSADTKSQTFIALNNRLKNIFSDYSNRMLFFSFWWKHLDEHDAQRILKGLKKNRYSMAFSRKLAKYLLKEDEEKIISIKDGYGSSALIELHDMLAGNLKFTWKGKTVTENEISDYMRSPNQKTRWDALQGMLSSYKNVKTELSHIFQTTVADYQKENLEMRKFSSALLPRALGDDIPEDVIRMVLDVCIKNESVFRDYFKLKKKILKLKKFNITDAYAPYPIKQRKLSYDKAVSLVLDTFNQFDPKFRKLAWNIIDADHIDSETRQNKYSGGFCQSFPAFIPYLLVHFKGTDDDIETLIHELGHGIHGQLSAKHSPSEYHASLGLCETASMFSEQLLFGRELAEETDKKRKTAKLMAIMDRLSGSIMRQARYTSFELDAYDLVQKGCTADDLDTAWMKHMRESYGTDIIFPEEYPMAWIRIPHFFHSHFYCYSYAFANLLVLALYAMYQKEGKTFPAKLTKILEYGGSKSTADILKEAGITISDRKFWENGFKLIKDYLNQLKQVA